MILQCRANKLPITVAEEELQSPVEVLAPYSSNLASKAPWQSILSTYTSISQHSSIDAPQDRANTYKCGSNMLDLKIGDSGLIQSPNYPRNYPPNAECTWWLKVPVTVWFFRCIQ